MLLVLLILLLLAREGSFAEGSLVYAEMACISCGRTRTAGGGQGLVRASSIWRIPRVEPVGWIVDS
jgi:hypothetical protein